MKNKNNRDGYILKSKVLLLVQNYIRSIQMNDYATDEGIPQLYSIMKQIENMQIDFEVYVSGNEVYRS